MKLHSLVLDAYDLVSDKHYLVVGSEWDYFRCGEDGDTLSIFGTSEKRLHVNYKICDGTWKFRVLTVRVVGV